MRAKVTRRVFLRNAATLGPRVRFRAVNDQNILSLQIGLVAAGEGSAAFRSFRYGETLKDRSTSQKENGK